MKKTFLLFLFIYALSNRIFAQSGCYVQLAVQGIDNNTLYTELKTNGTSYDYNKKTIKIKNTKCLALTTTTCYIYRAEFNNDHYDQGVIVTSITACNLDDAVLILLLISAVAGYFYLSKRSSTKAKSTR